MHNSIKGGINVLVVNEEVEFNEELYEKNVADNTFAEIDEFDGKGEEDVTDN